MTKQFTITIFTENRIGLLNRVSIVFTRRHINIDSITASESEVKDIYRYTIVIQSTETQVRKLVSQLEKQIEVIKAFYFVEDEVIHQEIALYKVQTSEIISASTLERIIRENNARILSIENGFFVIEKTGYKDETQQLFEQLEPYGVLQFARSGRVAITKQNKELTNYLKELQIESEKSDQIRDWKLNKKKELDSTLIN